MRKRPRRGNTTPRVKVVPPSKTDKPIPENSAQTEQPKLDPNLDSNGWPVRIGSIIQIENDIAVVTTVDNGALICRQLNETNGGDNSAWNCRNVTVIPGLAYHDDEQVAPSKKEPLNTSRNGLPVIIGSILKKDGRVYRATYQEHDWFTADTADTGMVLRATGLCQDYDVLPSLTASDDGVERVEEKEDESPAKDVNADADGVPIRVGDVVYEEGNPDLVGRVEVVHEGGCIYRVLSGGTFNKSSPGTCHGFQCRDMVVQRQNDARPEPLHIFDAKGMIVKAVEKIVDQIRENNPAVDQTGRPIRIGDIVCIDGPECGRVESVKEGCLMIRMFNWISPADRKLVDWCCDDCVIVDEGGR